jgi:molybdopterin binding domain protein (fragment)
MFCPTTVFDLVLPRIMAGDMVKKEEIDALGEGGLL